MHTWDTLEALHYFWFDIAICCMVFMSLCGVVCVCGSFIGEESMSDGGSCGLTDTPTWMVDPIDGTMNFVHK